MGNLESAQSAQGVQAVQDSSGVIQWYQNKSSSQEAQLLQELLRLDRDNRLDYRLESVQTVARDILVIMEDMVQYVRDNIGTTKHRSVENIRFTLEGCGSYFRGTKLHQPNEFDCALICDNHSRSSSLVGDIILLCDAGMRQVNLPDGWKHGGFKSPQYGGYRINGPAVMFQFVYSGPGYRELVVTVDLVVAFPEEREDGDNDWDRMCSSYNKTTWGVYKPKSRRFDCVRAPGHKTWLEQFDYESPVKTAIRILKILNCGGRQDVWDNDIIPRSWTNVLAATVQEWSESDLHDRSWSHVFADRSNVSQWNEENYRRYTASELTSSRTAASQLEGLGEIYPPQMFYSSHSIMKLVMMLQHLCGSAAMDPWTTEDVPRVVLTVLDIMHAQSKFCIDHQFILAECRLSVSNNSAHVADLDDWRFSNPRYRRTRLSAHRHTMAMIEKVGKAMPRQYDDAVAGNHSYWDVFMNVLHYSPAYVDYQCTLFPDTQTA